MSSSAPAASLDGVRVAIVGAEDASVRELERALAEDGAEVASFDLARSWSLPVSRADVVLLRIEAHELTHGTADRSPILETFSRLTERQRVIGLLDDAPDRRLAAMRDFAIKPFSAQEVASRIRRVLTGPLPESELGAGDLRLDEALRRVTVAGNDVPFTFNEFELLKALLHAQGVVLTRQDLGRVIHPGEITGDGRAIDIVVHRIRSKITGANGVHIETVRRVGYRLSSD